MAIAALVLAAATLGAQGRPVSARIQIAEGVYLFRSQPYGDVGLDGNSIAIISNDGVLVFDTNGTPAGAAAVPAEIRGDAPPLNNAFKTQLVDWYLHRVYDELNGPLTNAIAPIPPK